jgi:dienelactone hydrolase
MLDAPGRSQREPLHSDAVEARLVAGNFAWPQAGDLLTLPDGKRLQWTAGRVDEKGWLTRDSLRGGYVAWTVQSDERRVVLLEAAGHTAVNVNGEWRTGDHYGLGFLSLPVKLRKGENHFLFRVGRAGRVRASLLPPASAQLVDERDTTLPHLVEGASTRELGAVIVQNAAATGTDGLLIEASLDGGRPTRSRVPFLPALSAVKVPFAFSAHGTEAGAKLPLSLRLLDASAARVSSADLEIEVVAPQDARRVTFLSKVDGSVQYYGLQPAWSEGKTTAAPGLVLSTHGAGVQGLGQARAYAPKSWAHVVAPTNRRRFGFDWEDWGRLDAMEALAHARETLGTDPHRQYLTGHSMGGHGAWQLGVTFPDQWAVVGPSAGWISFRSYAGSEAVEHASDAAEILDRAWRPSDTLALVENLDDLGVFVIHGTDDDNVPATEARKMREVLQAREHPDFHYHEEPGKKHWWNLNEEPGADCVDWQPMFDLMARRSIAPAPRELAFVTAHPGVSSRSHWAEIVAVERAFTSARVALRHDPITRGLAGETENVFRLALDLSVLRGEGDVTVDLDGRPFTVTAPAGDRLLLERRGEDWVALPSFPSGDKKPKRCGPFRDAFRNDALLVYGTRGTSDENAWSLARARLDQETFRYRGNGSFDVLPDSAFRPEEHADRNVVLYGGNHVNAAWDLLLPDSPVSVERDQVRIGKSVLKGADLAVLLIRPRADSDTASVGIVAGTGLPGARLTDRIPYFVSGIAYPDLTVLDSSCLVSGPSGIRAAAFFGNDWTLGSGELALRP